MFGLFGDNGGGFFGNAFDLNLDGHLDPLERAADFGAFMKMVEEDEREYDDSGYDRDDYEDEEDFAEDNWDEFDDEFEGGYEEAEDYYDGY